MRVRKPISFPYCFNIGEFAELFEVGEEDHLTEGLAEALTSKAFEYIRPGNERASVLLRANDLSYGEIAWVLGIKEREVAEIFYKVRRRLLAAGIGQGVRKFQRKV